MELNLLQYQANNELDSFQRQWGWFWRLLQYLDFLGVGLLRIQIGLVHVIHVWSARVGWD